MSLSKQFTRREKVLLCILGLLLVGAAYYFAVHQPVETALRNLSFQQALAQDSLTVLQVKEQRLSQMREELEEILAQPNPAKTPKFDNLQQVMVFLNAILGSTTDYSLSFQPVKMPEDGSVVRRVINMSFTCATYAEARVVVEQLRDCVYRCQLGDLSMSPAAPTTPAAEQTADLTTGAVQVSLTATFFESLD